MLKKKNLENNKGIALIVLLIIVNILVAAVIVIVTLCLKGKTNSADDSLSDKKESITVNKKTEWVEIKKPTEWGANNNVKAMSNGIDIIPLPTGYTISTNTKENKIEEGLVVKDSNDNEFVWIPVSTDFDKTYSYSSDYSEPTELIDSTHSKTGFSHDSQEEIDCWYGKGHYDYPETEQEKANVNNDFAYVAHYEEMVDSVNKYNGFYIGRYETTIDEQGNIGSKINTTILNAGMLLKEGANPFEFYGETIEISFDYRWWGLYASQRNTNNIIGNKDYIQTNMIWGQQWDAMLEFLGTKQANSSISGYPGSVLKSAEATYSGEKDVINNIYDLRRNAYEWTAEANITRLRVMRGRLL